MFCCSRTTYLEQLTCQSAKQGSQLHRIQKTTENIHVLDGLRRIVTFLIVGNLLCLINTLTYLLTYLFTYVTSSRRRRGVVFDGVCVSVCLCVLLCSVESSSSTIRVDLMPRRRSVVWQYDIIPLPRNQLSTIWRYTNSWRPVPPPHSLAPPLVGVT